MESTWHMGCREPVGAAKLLPSLLGAPSHQPLGRPPPYPSLLLWCFGFRPRPPLGSLPDCGFSSGVSPVALALHIGLGKMTGQELSWPQHHLLSDPLSPSSIWTLQFYIKYNIFRLPY